jgi:hypothetical protein
VVRRPEKPDGAVGMAPSTGRDGRRRPSRCRAGATEAPSNSSCPTPTPDRSPARSGVRSGRLRNNLYAPTTTELRIEACNGRAISPPAVCRTSRRKRTAPCRRPSIASSRSWRSSKRVEREGREAGR